VACDQVQEHKMVFVVTENRLAIMAAVHDVVARLLGPLQTTGQAGTGRASGRCCAELKPVPAAILSLISFAPIY
jgi:hypothetical protein